MDAFPVAFGAQLRSLRQKLDLSQEEIAHRAGIHVTYLSGVERGRRNPSLRNIRRIASTPPGIRKAVTTTVTATISRLVALRLRP
ncbi:MAG: helix-turn-helix transcriptional regulator [Chloroflexota bacterium]